MKKLITMMLVIFMFTLAGCGKKEEPADLNFDAGSSTSEVSVSDIEESSEEPEVEEESPVDFDFMNGEEVNAEAIVAHAHKFGLLEENWKEPTEIDISNVLTAFAKSENLTTHIPETEFDEAIATFVDISVNILHQSEVYNAEIKECFNEYPINSDDDERILKAGEVNMVSKNIYEINVIDVTDENNPIDFGILIVENNDNMPKYHSFVKQKLGDPVANTPTTMGSGTDETSVITGGGATSRAGTDDTTGGETGNNYPNDPWANFEFPGDPNTETDTMVHVEWK